ncbi:MAG: branched-chain amino acid ABC transporter permease [Planctomycetota bacterium]|nr:branched-chain amino acid ABC transporter permease [Planctomycetota bacterium]
MPSTLPSTSASPLAFARAMVPLLVGLALAVIAQLFLAPQLNAYDAGLVLNVGINIILAVSLTIVNGFTGQFSIGHAGFLAVGGYVAGAITYYTSIAIWGNAETHGGLLSSQSLNADTPVWYLARGDVLFAVAVLSGGIVAAGVGYLVGLPSLRLRGDYLAIVTLGFGEIVRVLIQQTSPTAKPQILRLADHPLDGQLVYRWTERTPEGLKTIYTAVDDTSPLRLVTRLGGSLGFADTPDYTSFFWVTLAVVITLVVAFRVKYSTFGRAFLSIREDEIASEAMGVDTTKYKVRAFVLAAFFAGVAGGLYAHFKSMNPNEIGFARSFDFVIMVVLGGLGSISGATIAAIIVTLLPEWLRFLEDYRMIIWSLALILMMIFRPSGLLGVREVWDLWLKPAGKKPAGPGSGGAVGRSDPPAQSPAAASGGTP